MSVLVIAGGVYSGVRSGRSDAPAPGSANSAAASSPTPAPACIAATVLAPIDILPVVQERAATVTGDGGCRLLAVTEGTATTVANTVGSDGAAQAWVSDSPA